MLALLSFISLPPPLAVKLFELSVPSTRDEGQRSEWGVIASKGGENVQDLYDDRGSAEALERYGETAHML